MLLFHAHLADVSKTLQVPMLLPLLDSKSYCYYRYQYVLSRICGSVLIHLPLHHGFSPLCMWPTFAQLKQKNTMASYCISSLCLKLHLTWKQFHRSASFVVMRWSQFMPQWNCFLATRFYSCNFFVNCIQW